MSVIVKKKVISFGKHGVGNEVTIEMALRKDEEGRLEFAASGNVWNYRHSDIIMGGQCIDSIREKFKELWDNQLYREIEALWQRNHLNAMHAGTEKQEKALEELHADGKYHDYLKDCAFLESKGLLVDNGYKYGTAWLYRAIGDEDMKRIQEIMA